MRFRFGHTDGCENTKNIRFFCSAHSCVFSQYRRLTGFVFGRHITVVKLRKHTIFRSAYSCFVIPIEEIPPLDALRCSAKALRGRFFIKTRRSRFDFRNTDGVCSYIFIPSALAFEDGRGHGYHERLFRLCLIPFQVERNDVAEHECRCNRDRQSR